MPPFRVLSSLLRTASQRQSLQQQRFWNVPKLTSGYAGTWSLLTTSPLDRDQLLEEKLQNPTSSLPNLSLFWTQKRGLAKKKAPKVSKGKKGDKRAAGEDDDDEDGEGEDSDADDDDDTSEDVKVFNTTVISLRLDAIGKTCFNIPRAKVEESFYNDLIRVNGERVAKKSYDVRIDDEIDLIRGQNLEDRTKLDINRVQILSVDDKAASSGRIRISYRKTNNLTVDNYSRDPYEGAL